MHPLAATSLPVPAPGRYQLLPATEAHAAALAATIRPDDAAEVEATVGPGVSPLDGLLQSLRGTFAARGGLARTLVVDGEVAAIWGVRPLVELQHDTGVVWMLTGKVVDRVPRLFAGLSLCEVGRLLQLYRVLLNHIDCRYIRALRWAAWTGAELHAPRPWGAMALPFVPAVWRRS
jgi:hypothetical protein